MIVTRLISVCCLALLWVLFSSCSVHAQGLVPVEKELVDLHSGDKPSQLTIDLAETSSEGDSASAHAQSTQAESVESDPPEEQFVFPAEQHLWGHFPVGSWRETEIATETLDDVGKVYGRSVTTQKEVLKALADDSYVLEVQATVVISGKEIVGPINTRILRRLTDRSGAIFSEVRQEDELLTVGNASVACQVWDVVYSEETSNWRDRIYFSSDTFPYVIRRDRFENVKDSPIAEIATESSRVLAVQLPFSLEGRVIPCVCEQSHRQRGKGGTQTVKLISREIPGGEVQSWSTDFDIDSRPNRWSVLKLLDYGVARTGGVVQPEKASAKSSQEDAGEGSTH